MADGKPLKIPGFVTIGVTGHRFLQNRDELIPAIEAVLDVIAARWPELSLRIISALAEGSDRLVVEQVLLRSGAQLIVPLPLPEDEYMRDFRSQESPLEFLSLLSQASHVVRLPAALTRTAAYTAAGDYMLAHCDLLIALWDGQPAQGDGGTGNVVAAAQAAGLPLVWIHTHNDKPGSQTNGLATPQGTVTYENW